MSDPPLYELAGDHTVIEETPDGGLTFRFDSKGLGRSCGSCQLCCRLLPVPRPLGKPANQRCQHQKHGKGCTIYKNRPMPCVAFSCRWLADPRGHDLPRPDRCGYVVDMTPDKVVITAEDGSDKRWTFDVIQVWVDPARPNAHRDPKLRAYLAKMAAELRYAALIRFNPHDAIAVFPPAISADGQWHERSSNEGNTRIVPELEMHPELAGVLTDEGWVT